MAARSGALIRLVDRLTTFNISSDATACAVTPVARYSRIDAAFQPRASRPAGVMSGAAKRPISLLPAKGRSRSTWPNMPRGLWHSPQWPNVSTR